MTTIPGASQFLNSATLANQQGLAAQQDSFLGTAAGSTSLLDIGRSSLFDNGIGLSSTARLLNTQQIEANSQSFNEIFSLGLGAAASVEGLQQEILALRANIPESGLARSLVLESDDGGVAESETGQTIDTQA